MGLTCRPECPPRHRLLFYELCAYISRGVHRKVYFRRVLHLHRYQPIPA
jgi:hypothetical protein